MPRTKKLVPEDDPFYIIEVEELINKYCKSVGGGVDKIKIICAILYDLLTCRLILFIKNESIENQDIYFSDLVFDACFKNF